MVENGNQVASSLTLDLTNKGKRRKGNDKESKTKLCNWSKGY